MGNIWLALHDLCLIVPCKVAQKRKSNWQMTPKIVKTKNKNLVVAYFVIGLFPILYSTSICHFATFGCHSHNVCTPCKYSENLSQIPYLAKIGGGKINRTIRIWICNYTFLIIFLQVLRVSWSTIGRLGSISFFQNWAKGRFQEKKLLLFWILSKRPNPIGEQLFSWNLPKDKEFDLYMRRLNLCIQANLDLFIKATKFWWGWCWVQLKVQLSVGQQLGDNDDKLPPLWTELQYGHRPTLPSF